LNDDGRRQRFVGCDHRSLVAGTGRWMGSVSSHGWKRRTGVAGFGHGLTATSDRWLRPWRPARASPKMSNS
jgi:hypothetical protein